MADNDTRIKITAVDAASAVLKQISGKAGELESSFRSLLAVGAAGVSIAGFITSIKAAIDTAASMEELSQKTGIATKELSALDYAMRREGVSTESFGKAMKELSKNMVEAGDATSKTGKLFAALGVNTQGNTREALLKLADTFQKLPDGATKAALAVNVFGKAGMDLIPALNNGAAGIREIEAEAKRLGITLDTETGKAAKDFKDNMFAVQESAKALGMAIAERALPQLLDISRAMKAAAEDGGLLKAAWIGLGGLASAALGIGDAPVSNTKKIAEVTGEIVALEQENLEITRQGLKLQKDALEARDRRMASLKDELKVLNLIKAAEEGKFDDQASRRGQSRKPGAGTDTALEREVARRMRDDAAAKSAAANVGADYLVRLQQEYEKLNNVTHENETLERVLADLKQRSFATIDAGLKAQFIAQAKLTDAAKARLKIEDIEREGQAALAANTARRAEEVLNLGNAWEKEAQALQFEATLIGMTNLERQKALLLEKARVDLATAGESIEAAEKIEASLGKQLSLLEQITGQQLALQEAQAQERDRLQVWDEFATRGSQFFVDLVTNGKNAFKNLGQSLKDFGRELLAIFAKRWLLSIGASLTSGATSAALSTASSAVGGASLAGSLAGGALSFGTSVIGGFQGASLAAGLAGPTTAGASIFSGSGLGAGLATMGPIGWAALAVAAVAAVAMAFRDKGENWRATLGFGNNANAYATDGVFGREGFQQIAGNDATNRSIQSFMAATKPLDLSLAARLTPEQMAQIRSSLGGAYTTRNDGQPAEFAFGKEDGTAAQQLTLEYLQKKYGTIFDTIDSKFADWIRSYKGTSEDLLAAIGEFAGFLDMLDASGIKGLNIETLRGFQRAGEEIGGTLTRITQGFAAYQDAFLTDAEKLDAVKQLIASTFASLDIAVPTSMAAFKDLVNSLDLTTVAGRTAFEALMTVAPGFAAVANAAAAALASLNATAGRLNPAFGSQFARSNLVGAVESWRGIGDHSNWSVDQTIGNIGNLAHDPMALAAAIAYAQSLGADAVTTLNNMLAAYLDWEASMGSSGAAAQDLAGSFSGAASGVTSFADTIASAKNGIKDWLDGIFLSSLSPLKPNERLDFSANKYVENLMRAQAGDVGALSQFTSFADAYLKEAQSYYASSDAYKAIFDAVTQQAGDLAGLSGVRPLTATDAEKNTAITVAALDKIRESIEKMNKDLARAMGTQTGSLLTGGLGV